MAQIPVPRLIFAKIPVTKSKIPLLITNDYLQNHAHNKLKALIDAIWIHVPSPGLKKISHFVHTFHLLYPPSVKKGFVKGEALRILRTNSSKTTFEENISNFKIRLIDRGYPQTMIEKPSIRYKVLREGVCSPETQQQKGKRNIAFRDTVPALSVYFKRSFNEKLDLIQNQPLLRQIFKEPPIISYKKGKSLKDMLVS